MSVCGHFSLLFFGIIICISTEFSLANKIMETSASPKANNNSMDWNLGLGKGGKEHDTGKFLDDSDDFTPLPFDNFSHGGTSNEKAAEQILYERHPEPLLSSNVGNLNHIGPSSDKVPPSTAEISYERSAEPSSPSTGKRKFEVTGGPPRKANKKKTPKDFPRPPLSAYNIFFQKHRPQMMKECSKSQRLQRGELGKAMGNKWRKLSDEERKKYEDISEADVIRHREEMKAYREARRKKFAFENNLLLPSMDCYSQNRSTMSQSSDSSSSEQGHVGIAYRPPHFAVVSPASSRRASNSSLPPQAQIPRRRKPETYLEPSSNFALKSRERFGSYGYNSSHVFDTEPNEALPSEVYLRDERGAKKKYHVTYKCYRMTKSEAINFTNRMTAKANDYANNLQPHTISSGFGVQGPLVPSLSNEASY